ncbi:unnamed protein product [Heligmosomoides polygyrus]|uniref:Male-enhanced antigen 1 n=1 Tax=Heligmosomoides polygyrus TaxID=6339 RepID=A0A183GM83_HELPZ|nr:unnamed protein product [Heligmosomoides polygyrus]
MNGVGFADDRDSDEGSGFPDTDPESDDGIDEADEETVGYSGYRALPLQGEEPSVESDVASEQQFVDENASATPDDDTGESEGGAAVHAAGVSYPVMKEFEKLIQDKSSSSRSLFEEPIPHRPNNIVLDAEKVEAIQEAMSGFVLPPPPHWANLDINRLTDIIKEKFKSSDLQT